MNIVFSTRTKWSEPQRLRHQMADLLVKMGHTVTFLELPCHFFQKPKNIESVSPKINLVQVRELMHPQLRFCEALTTLDQLFRKRQIRKLLSSLSFDVHFSFYIDSYLLFPNIPTVQVINDDFVGKGSFLSKATFQRNFQRSLDRSQFVLTVSHPLAHLVNDAGGQSINFFPWYVGDLPTAQKKTNNRVLYFGYLAGRVRWEIIEFFLVKGIHIDLYAPLSSAKPADRERLSALSHFSNFHFHGEGKLEEISSSNYICSLQPYDRTIPNTDMITFSNRTVRLLALGIPSLHEKLPHLISCKETVIYQAHTPEEYFAGYSFLKMNANDSFHDISQFLTDHSELNRQVQLQTLLDDLNNT